MSKAVLAFVLLLMATCGAWQILHPKVETRRFSLPWTTTNSKETSCRTPERWPAVSWEASSSSAATVAILLAANVLLAQPKPALGAATVGLPPSVSVLNQDYADPLHPYCRRHIQVNPDGITFHYSGTALASPEEDGVLRGCSPQEKKLYPLRQGSFEGTIRFDSNTQQLVVSAGDGIHEGVWEPAHRDSTTAATASDLTYKTMDGIRWNDGNKWVVQSQAVAKPMGGDSYQVIPKPQSTVIGEGIFYAYLGFSILAGVKGVIDAVIRKQSAEEKINV